MEELKKNLVINGRYQLKEYIGSGSFGEVWRAYDKTEKLEVAIKIYISLDKRGCDEFMDEYRIASTLKHKNLLVTEAYDLWKNRPFLTMKFCPNGSAAAMVGKLKPSKKDERVIWQFVRDVAAGLAYLHNIEPDPIVHQDIKPDNVLIDADGIFLITDFGISKRVRSTLRQQSSRAQKAGAVAYMGPERFSNKPNPILASDIWSLGASIYELAEGELPFAGQGGVMLKNGADMVDLGAGWSEKLNTLVHACLEKEPWDRYKAHEIEAVATDVLNDYDAFYEKASFLKSDESGFDPRKTIRKDEGQSNPPVQKKDEVSSIAKPKKRSYRIGIAVAALALVLGLGGGYYLYTNRSNVELDAALADVDSYLEQVEQCEKLIQTGDAGHHEILLNAKNSLEELKKYEQEHSNVMPETYNNSKELEVSLEQKLKAAANEWAVAAKAQVDNLGNYEQARQFYQLSLSLYEDEKVRRELDMIEQLTDTIYGAY